MPMRHIDIVLISVHTPLICGIYENNQLISQSQSDELLLKALPNFFESVLPSSSQDPMYFNTKIDAIYYANGPGSFSALKLTHIFLQTLHIVHGIKLFATSSFYFTSSAYIKAFGNSYFHQNAAGEISLIQNAKALLGWQLIEAEFSLPHILDRSAFGLKVEPLYVLPPV